METSTQTHNIGVNLTAKHHQIPPKMALVKDLLARNTVTIGPNANLADALKTMLTSSVHRLPVLDDKNKLVGIITDRDVRLACNSPFVGNSAEKDIEELSKHQVKECMNSIVMTVDDDATVIEAAKLIRVRGVGGLPVVNNAGDLVGIVTRSDLIDHLIRVLSPYDPSTDTEKVETR